MVPGAFTRRQFPEVAARVSNDRVVVRCYDVQLVANCLLKNAVVAFLNLAMR